MTDVFGEGGKERMGECGVVYRKGRNSLYDDG